MVKSQDIRELLDNASIPDREKILKLSEYLLIDPGGFWPAIGTRMLGKKRISELERLGMIASISEDKGIKTAGEYLVQVVKYMKIFEYNDELNRLMFRIHSRYGEEIRKNTYIKYLEINRDKGPEAALDYLNSKLTTE
jgi:hypothetical protein